MPTDYRNKPSEARDILNALQAAGMERVAIARALGVKAMALRNIARGQTPGINLAPRLRALYEASKVQFPGKLPELPAQSPQRASPTLAAALAPGESPAAALAVSAEMDAADVPPDERTTGQRVRESIRGFLMGKDGATAVIDAAERKQSGKAAASDSLDERQARFVEQIAPILGLAIMILGYFTYPDPYRDCGPTQPEGEAMIRPILRIAARQLEIAGQLSENTVDILASLAAVAVYAQRSWDTFKEIRRGDERSERHQQQQHNTGSTGRSDTAAPAALHFAPSATPAYNGQQAQGGQPGGTAGPAGGARNPEDGSPLTDEQRRATALLDGVLAADADGRRRLALN